MGEFRIVFALLLILIGLGLVRIVPPYYLIWGLVVVLNLIQVVVLLINIWQAWKRDKRFLHGAWLGFISVLVGLGLMSFFSWFGSGLSMALLCGGPWLAGGVFVMILSAVRAVLPNRKQE